VQAAQPWLESAVTFILKDSSFRTDRVVAAGDAERYYQAFNALATLYIAIGWAWEGLALLETHRGRALDLSRLKDEARTTRKKEARTRRTDPERARLRDFLGADPATVALAKEESEEMLRGGRKLGPFVEDYELAGLSERVASLHSEFGDVRTVFVSLAVDEDSARDGAFVSAVILRPPGTGKPRIRFDTWRIEAEPLGALRSDVYRRPGSFREGRLVTLGDLIHRHLLAPIAHHLSDRRWERVIFVTPSSFSNLPIEAYAAVATTADDFPRRVAFLPALMFSAGMWTSERSRKTKKKKKAKDTNATKKGKKNRRNTVAHDTAGLTGVSSPEWREASRERLLIIGYEGRDLRRASDEASDLQQLFGDRAVYLRGEDCTKRRVVEELNHEYEYIHLICHGTYEPDRPSESSLIFRDAPVGDGYRLRAREIEELVRLVRRPIVTLSACSTALTADSRSNTWLGLPGALLRAGARAIVGTRWPVRDEAAAEMMGYFYRTLINTHLRPMTCFFAMQEQSRRQHGRVEDWACFGYLGLP
jgi:hypothetical protein